MHLESIGSFVLSSQCSQLSYSLCGVGGSSLISDYCSLSLLAGIGVFKHFLVVQCLRISFVEIYCVHLFNEDYFFHISDCSVLCFFNYVNYMYKNN